MEWILERPSYHDACGNPVLYTLPDYGAAMFYDAIAGTSSGDTIDLIQRLAREELPQNMQYEWTDMSYLEVIAGNTPKEFALQLDVGTCLKAGSHPVAWIRGNPGRIHSMHCKDWSPDPAKGYTVLFGEGAGDWKAIFAAAESVGGVEYYLIEQEGSRMSELDTVRQCLKSYREMRK